MGMMAHVIKLIQFTSLAVWFFIYSPGALTVGSILGQPPWRLALGLGGMALGQLFNAAIYAAIGQNGVYYGNRFGATLGPWVTGFPFNVPLVGRHPQYFGVLLSIWGGTCVVCDADSLAAGFHYIALVWSCLYVFTALVEQTEGTRDAGKQE